MPRRSLFSSTGAPPSFADDNRRTRSNSKKKRETAPQSKTENVQSHQPTIVQQRQSKQQPSGDFKEALVVNDASDIAKVYIDGLISAISQELSHFSASELSSIRKKCSGQKDKEQLENQSWTVSSQYYVQDLFEQLPQQIQRYNDAQYGYNSISSKRTAQVTRA